MTRRQQWLWWTNFNSHRIPTICFHFISFHFIIFWLSSDSLAQACLSKKKRTWNVYYPRCLGNHRWNGPNVERNNKEKISWSPIATHVSARFRMMRHNDEGSLERESGKGRGERWQRRWEMRTREETERGGKERETHGEDAVSKTRYTWERCTMKRLLEDTKWGKYILFLFMCLCVCICLFMCGCMWMLVPVDTYMRRPKIACHNHAWSLFKLIY